MDESVDRPEQIDENCVDRSRDRAFRAEADDSAVPRVDLHPCASEAVGVQRVRVRRGRRGQLQDNVVDQFAVVAAMDCRSGLPGALRSMRLLTAGGGVPRLARLMQLTNPRYDVECGGPVGRPYVDRLTPTFSRGV